MYSHLTCLGGCIYACPQGQDQENAHDKSGPIQDAAKAHAPETVFLHVFSLFG